MKLHRIIAICLLACLLSGCAMIGLLSDMAEDDESSKPLSSESTSSDKSEGVSGDNSESRSASIPAISKPKEQSTASAQSSSEPEAAPLSPALEGILAEAPRDCILAVVRLPDAPRFATLEEPSFSMDLSGDYPGQISETVWLVPLVDGISVSVERYETHFTLPWTLSNEVLYQLDGKLGEVYALHTFLAEGVPDIKVMARIDGKETAWICMMDGMGGMEIEYLWPPWIPAEETFLAAAYVYPITEAAAIGWLAYGDDGFWETVAYAIARTEEDCFIDTGAGRKITLSQDRFASYVETIFPGYTAWPPMEDSDAEDYFSYNAADESYEITYFDISETAVWSYITSHEDDDGKGGRITGAIYAPGISKDEESYVYEVVWREKTLRGEKDPIAFEIIEIRATGEKVPG